VGYYFKASALICAALLLVVGGMFLLVQVFDVDAEILRSLKFVVPLLVGLGIVLAVLLHSRIRKVR
jgi:hypothetical protein